MALFLLFYPMTRLTFTVYMCNKLPRISSVWLIHNLVLSALMSYHPVCCKCNTTGATSGAGTIYPSELLSSPWYLLCFVLLNV